MIHLNKPATLLSKDEVNSFSIEDQIDLLPNINFEEDSNGVMKVMQSPLFQSIFAYYQENYSNDLLRSKPLIEQQIGTYLYITGQDAEQQAKIDNALYWRYCPTIEEFINDDQYLGKLFRNTLYPYWKRAFSEIYSPESCINKVILAGSTGSGKSTAARIGLLYAMYRVLCLRNPQSVLGITQEAALSSFILSVNLKLAEKTNYDPFLAILDNAACFSRTRNIDDFYSFGPLDPVPFMVSRSSLSIKFPNNLNFLIGSESSHIVSHNVVCSFSDEISEKSSPVEIEKTLDLLNAIDSRLQNRFMGSNFIIQFIASSAKTNRSALAEYIKNTPKTPAFKIYDPRAWEIKTDSAFIGDGSTFPVLVGNGVIQSRILEQEDEIKAANEGTFHLENGCEILQVPNTFKAQFEMNLTRSLQDIAGIVTSESNLLVHDTSKLEDPILTPELHIEANLGDDVKIVDMLPSDMFEEVNGKVQLKRYPKAQRYMHCDLAEAGGKSEAGLSLCHKEYYIDPRTQEKQIFYVFDFVMWINAKARIDLTAIERFIYDLMREKNIVIDSFSSDQFQSTLIRQNLELSGLVRNVCKVSVDVTCTPYEYFASQIELGRVKVGMCDYLKRQLHALKLQDGKVQRTTERKDMADSSCGSVELARLNYQDDPIIHGYEYFSDLKEKKEVNILDLVPEDFKLVDI